MLNRLFVNKFFIILFCILLFSSSIISFILKINLSSLLGPQDLNPFLLDFGIKVIISESFADIFYNNCFKNGILPVIVSEDIVNELKEYSSRKENIEVKLQEQEVVYGNKSFKFKLDSFKKKCLLEGLDDIALSLKKVENINNFESKMSQSKPWL